MVKTCACCGNNKPPSSFYKHKLTSDGLNSSCKDCVKARANKWHHDNHEHSCKIKKSYSKKWLRENKATHAARQAKRRADKIQATPTWLKQVDLDEINQIYRSCRLRTQTTGVEHHVDHIVPLKGKDVCGLHVPWNLQIIPASENRRKHNKHKG